MKGLNILVIQINENMNDKIVKVLKYYENAGYFIKAAGLVTDYKQKNLSDNQNKNFEGVVVGTLHAFSIELLVKGIIIFHKGNLSEDNKKHELDKLLNSNECKSIFDNLKQEFNHKFNTLNKPDFSQEGWNQYKRSLDKNKKSEKEKIKEIKEIKEIDDTLAKFGVNSFEFFLKLHSNLFTKMRYASEQDPTPVDFDFTCFLINQLVFEYQRIFKDLGI